MVMCIVLKYVMYLDEMEQLSYLLLTWKFPYQITYLQQPHCLVLPTLSTLHLLLSILPPLWAPKSTLYHSSLSPPSPLLLLPLRPPPSLLQIIVSTLREISVREPLREYVSLLRVRISILKYILKV